MQDAINTVLQGLKAMDTRDDEIFLEGITTFASAGGTTVVSLQMGS